MPWDPVPSTFERSRRRETYRRLARLLKKEDTSALPSLDEARKRLSLFEQRYVGIRPIPLDKIVGTAERAPDFDEDFLPTVQADRQRWQRLEKLSRQGSIPSIAVYKVGELYYVIDGHHRVSTAKALKQEFIDAEITELFSRYEIPPTTDIGRLILTEQESLFMEESGLDRARPEARIEFSRPLGYIELLEVVRAYGYELMKDRQQLLDDAEVAGDFYDDVYLPAIEAIKQEDLFGALPNATEADLFLWVWYHRRSLFPEHGGMSLQDAARRAGEGELASGRTRSKLGLGRKLGRKG